MRARTFSTLFTARVLGLLLLLIGPRLASAYDWLPPTNKVALLAIHAHADDEGEFFGGALPYYASLLKLPTVLVCMATTTSPVREDELRGAAWTYGVRYEPLFPRFKEIYSNQITNRAYTNTIDITWDYWADNVFQGDGSDVEAGKTRAINYIAEQIRRYRPDVIITHDAGGEYGHDNHKATAWAVTNAFFVAADPNATAPNLVGLPPWQAQKLYLHLYATNRLFHKYWETPFVQLSNRSPRQLANLGLQCHLSQTGAVVYTVHEPTVPRSIYASEWWGLYASRVGPDTVLTNRVLVDGYLVPPGVAAGNFLEHVVTTAPIGPPWFTANPIFPHPASLGSAYVGETLAAYAEPWSHLTWDPNDILTFSKASGPAWLTVAPDGTLGGTPGAADLGTNTWLVRATGKGGLFAEATLSIIVPGRFAGLDGLAGWWRLDDDGPPPQAGSTPMPVRDWALPAPDGAGYGGLGLGQGGPRPWLNRAMFFNGADAKVDVPYSPLLATTPVSPAFTAALWVKPTGGAGTWRSPLCNSKSSPPNGYVFYASTTDRWQFRIGNDNTWVQLNAGPVVLNTWVHLAATYDSTTARFYINGVLAASAPAAAQFKGNFPLRIGAGFTESAGQYWFPGFIADVRVCRIPYSAAQVWDLYANPPRLTGLYRTYNNLMHIRGAGAAGQNYLLLASTNPLPGSFWTSVSTATADSSGNFEVADPDSGIYPQRFYRLAAP